MKDLDQFIVDLPPIEAGGFINRPPLIRPLPNYKQFLLYESVSYDVGGPNSGDRITVPAGFLTDFASIPKAFRGLIDRMGKHSGAAIIHDYLYVTQDRSRKESDRIFLEAMKVLKVSWVTRNIMYRAVRVGGGAYWGEKEQEIDIDEIQP